MKTFKINHFQKFENKPTKKERCMCGLISKTFFYYGLFLKTMCPITIFSSFHLINSKKIEETKKVKNFLRLSYLYKSLPTETKYELFQKQNIVLNLTERYLIKKSSNHCSKVNKI